MKIFPSVYYVHYTNPQIIFQVLPGIQKAYTPYPMAYAVIYGLNVVVEQCVIRKGDAKLPAAGITFVPASVGVSIKSHAPGTVDITYSMTAEILRGIWELTAYYGSYTLTVDIYVGAVRPALYRGRATVFIKFGDSNTIVDAVAPIGFSDTTVASG